MDKKSNKKVNQERLYEEQDKRYREYDITKDMMFNLGKELMDMDEEARLCVMDLTALLNRQKNDSFYIPKAFVSSYNYCNFLNDEKQFSLTKEKCDRRDHREISPTAALVETTTVLKDKLKVLGDKEKNSFVSGIRHKILEMSPLGPGDKGNWDIVPGGRFPECVELFFDFGLDEEIRNFDKRMSAEDIVARLMAMNQGKE